ncbi:hypothetical protein [Leifsonia sp. Leaf264]|uniref:hypothetical protein n=1 Tax=Leifsonia sp. Leaf264 TaxID=1736314 RepID=UPI0006FAA017|nr:hypothetical protein [Leifsonia sp. Leaf264]KQO98322.1 hypothetical protein ASF30_09690 [Leifsonia sp. Leaf264]
MGFLDKLRSKKNEPTVVATVTINQSDLRAAGTSVEAKLVDYEALQKAEDQASKVRGKHYTEWGDDLDRLRKDGPEDEYLALVLDCVDGAERAAKVNGREPAPAYTERAAVVYRRRKDYAAEVAVLQRWEDVCPPERRGPGATQPKLLVRKAKALELLASTGS